MPTIETEKSLSDADFAKLRVIVHKHTGITIAENRKSMLFSRLQRRLRVTGQASFANYIKFVSQDPKEMQELTNRVTTNETYFYRTPRIWSHFRESTVPDYLQATGARPMKVWSAAASTGAEAYTIGVLLEEVRAANRGFDYSILGTDISSQVIDVAEEGRYVGRPIARFKREEPTLFAKHMIGDDEEGYSVSADIRRRISFRLHNLLSPVLKGGPFDAVFLRNVLIYFTDEDQEKILSHVFESMRPGGTLIIGESETLANLNTGFDPIAPLIYRAARKQKAASQ